MTVISLIMGGAPEGNKDVEVDIVVGENDEKLQSAKPMWEWSSPIRRNSYLFNQIMLDNKNLI